MIIDENGVKIAIAHNNLSRSAEHLGNFCDDGSADQSRKTLTIQFIVFEISTHPESQQRSALRTAELAP